MFYFNSPIPFSLNKIVLDKDNNPIDFIIVDVNREFKRLFNQSRKKFIGKYGREIFKNLDYELVKNFGYVALTRRNLSFKYYIEDLNKYFVLNVFSPEKYYFFVLFEDFKEFFEEESKLKKLLNLKSVIRKINNLINSCKDEKEFYKKVCDEIIKINGIISAWIGLKKEDFIVEPVSFSGVLSEYLKSIIVKWDDSELGSGPTGKAIKNNKIFIINDITIDESFFPWKEKALSYDVKSIASFPITYEDEVIGALTVHSNRENFFNDDIIDVLDEISNDIGIYIRKFIDKEKIMKKTRELEQTIDNMLSSFSKIISLKEPYTGDHSLRVSKLVLLISKEMNIDENRLLALKYASFLHDLGKIFIPSEILNKYGKLSSNEYDLVKEHVLKSYEIIKDINFPYPTKEIILQHHERLDGSGYPNGLKKDEILLEAKILAVADVIDAMLSNRPYRPPLDKEKVKEELIRNRGVLYDEKVIDVALKIVDELKYD